MIVTVPSWGTVTLIELLWLLAGLVAVAAASYNLVDAVRDLRALALLRERGVDEPHSEMIRLIARGNVRDEILRLGIAMLITTTGIVGVFTANPAGGRTTLTGLFVTAALVGIAFLTAARGVLDAGLRHRLYELATRV